ncbi:hypothetical protein GGH96_005481, partial [Coemansia sp. RSA 1972]
MKVLWVEMAHRYKMSQANMELVLATDDDRLQKRMSLSVRVSQWAEWAYDQLRGRYDWELVARDLEMPLIECLQLFDADFSNAPVRSLPNITDWSADDLSTLKSFVSEHFGAITADEWRLVGAFMNVEKSDCSMAHNICTHPRMTPDLHEAITRKQNKGQKWTDIFKQHPIFSSASVLHTAYNRFNGRIGSNPKIIIKNWSDEETHRIQELIQNYYKPGDLREVVIRVLMEFPKRTEASILDKIQRTTVTCLYITNNDMYRVNKLVEAYGEDWELIGEEMYVSPRSAQWIWAQHQQRQKVTEAWTDDELNTLRKCVRGGIGMAEASRIIGTKSPYMCHIRFDEGSYVCFEGQEYHHQCVDALASRSPNGDEPLVCGECNNHIEGVFLRHNNGVFHPKCFCCADCECAITPGMPFGEVDMRPC